MRKVSEDYIGTCQACFGEYKVGDDRAMVLHGYLRPGNGEVRGRCCGTDHPPFEYGHALTDKIIVQCRQTAETCGATLARLRAGEIVSLPRTWTEIVGRGWDRREIPKCEMIGPDSVHWRAEVERVIRSEEHLLRHYTEMADYMQQRVDGWAPGQIVGLDLPATGRMRGLREAYDPARAASEARNAAARAEREARPGKLKVTLYWMEATRVGDMAAGEMRAIKGWIRDRFGAGKARVLAGYASDVPLAVRQAAGQAGDLYRRVVIAHIDWSHLDDVLTTLEGAIRIDHGKIAMAAATWRSSWPNYSGFRRGHGLRRRRRGRRAGRAPGGRANRAG